MDEVPATDPSPRIAPSGRRRTPAPRALALLLAAAAACAWAFDPVSGPPAGTDAAGPAPQADADQPAPPATAAPPAPRAGTGADARGLPYAEAVAARFPAPPVVYETPGLAPGRERFTANDELAAALRAIAARGGAALVEPGRSAGGEPLLALHFGHGGGRPAALLIGQQHGDEPAGAEALLVVAERLANPADPLAAVLERLDVVVLPRANPDGARAGQRRNAAGQDPNRDHLRMASPEAQAIAALMQRWRPVMVADLHEYLALGGYVARLGAIKRHDLLMQGPGTPNLPPAVAAATEAWLRQPLTEALDAQRIRHDWYHVQPAVPESGARPAFSMGGLSAGLARNAAGLRHAPTLLLESRGFDLGRLHLQRRVHAQVMAVDALLRAAAARADDLAALRDDADAAVAARACRGAVVVEAAMTPGARRLRMLDPTTGADVDVEVAWSSALLLQPRRSRARPCAYWLAADQAVAVARLRALGVQVTTLAQPLALQAERYRVTAEGRRQDPGGGAALRQVAVELEAQPLQAPAGSHLVRLDQPLAPFAVAALEPDGADSYVAAGIVDSVDALARVMAWP